MNKKDTLVIIGNGFDIWQKLNTSYFEFRKYYLKHRDEILESLGISKIIIEDSAEGTLEQTAVELIYGDPFEVDELGDSFWKTFEASLGKIDSQRLNLFFDKDEEGLEWMETSANNARRILTKAFNDWIDTINIEDDQQFHDFMMECGLGNFRFNENCYFINFNYTDVLEKRFYVDEDDVFHIHGQCRDEDEVIFGHADHPQEPQHELEHYGGRFKGLYHIEKILYDTDKHVQNIIQELKFMLLTEGINAADIKHIYVLGHSLGEADLEYFDFLVDATSVDCGEEYKDFFKDKIYYDSKKWSPKRLKKVLKKGDSFEELNNRLQYTIKRYGYDVTDHIGLYGFCEDILPEELKAVRKKYGIEQSLANADIAEQFLELLEEVFENPDPVDDFSEGYYELYETDLKPKKIKRTKDAMWHISCYSKEDYAWAEKVMKGLGCKNYKLYATIEECLKELKA